MFNAIALFPTMRDMHYRESRDGFYNSWMFLCTYIAHVVPFAMLASVIFATFTYWLGSISLIMFLCVFVL